MWALLSLLFAPVTSLKGNGLPSGSTRISISDFVTLSLMAMRPWSNRMLSSRKDQADGGALGSRFSSPARLKVQLLFFSDRRISRASGFTSLIHGSQTVFVSNASGASVASTRGRCTMVTSGMSGGLPRMISSA